MTRIVTLLTDFGTADGYVGEIKGVLASAAPDATIVDVTHDVAPHDVDSARLALARYWRRFPPGTVHLVVVDPGVGGSRAAIAVESEQRFLVGPDNGVLSPAFGALRLTDRVPAYRVDPCARVPGVGVLDQEWRPALAEALDSLVKPRELLVDCRSSTYAAMWRPRADRAERWVRITVPGASHHAKHTRGLVARELSRSEAPRTPAGLAERLAHAFEVHLTPPERAGRPWTLAVQER